MRCLIYFCLFFSCVVCEKVIIIGAGAAGIAAASRLLDHNITDFKILEAENRIGGRIHSFHFGNAYVDLGAEFVHGEKGNIVYDLAKNIVKPGSELKSAEVYYAGDLKTGEDLCITSRVIYEELSTNNSDARESMGEAYLSRYNTTILEKYKNDTGMLEYAKNMLWSIECMVNSYEGSFSWFSPSVLSNFVTSEGDQGLTWNGLGYKTLFDLLLKNFPDKTGYKIENHLSLQKTVTKVVINGDTINVTCQDGSEYSSNHVIFTPSLGVLKNNHDTIFHPKLSDEKVEAMQLLGIDGVMKVIFEFPSKWWGERETFLFVWTEDEKRNLIKKFPHGPVKDGNHWLSSFTVIVQAPNNPNVLIAWILGPLIPEIEKLSDEEMKGGMLYVLRQFLGKRFNISEPTKVVHSKWVTNPNFRGTYSYENVRRKHSNITSPQSVLLQPIVDEDGTPRICFAGEATNPTRFATVDGAVGSGFREGDRLAAILKKGGY